MNEITLFSYIPGTSLLHRLDPRVKFCFIIVFTVAASVTYGPELLFLSALLLVILLLARIPSPVLLAALKQAAVFIVAVGLIGALMGGPEVRDTVTEVHSNVRSKAISGALLTWRLSLFLIAGILFTATTPHKQIRLTVSWLAGPLPWIKEKDLGLMISLIFAFIPRLFRQIKTVRAAHYIRGVNLPRNPVKKIKMLLLSVMRIELRNTDEIAEAMEARGYSHNRSGRLRKVTTADILFLVLSLLSIGVIIAV